MSELKACPFCGKVITSEKDAFSGDGFPFMCRCAWETGSAEEVMKRWNTRPIEDALTARIAELEGAMKKIAELENKWDAPNDFSNELQKIAQEVLK